MKIALINIYQGEIERGAETFVLELSKRLANNHLVRVFSGGKKPQKRWPIIWRAFLDPHGIQVFIWTLKILPQIWKAKYDIVVPLNGGWQPAFLRLITWLYGGKMIVSGQSGMGWDDRNNLWCFPDAFVALTSNAIKWAKKANPLVKRVTYIPNGVDLDKFKPQGNKYKTGLKKPIVLCVGALTPQKRINLVIDTVSKLNEASLLVAAGDKDRVNIAKLGRALLGSRFKLISVPYTNMPDVYRVADIFTLVSESTEAFGNVFVEAMAANLPVVAVNDEQRREIIGDAGLYVDDPTDLDSYANLLKKALNTEWGNKPRNQAQKFDWDKIAKKYEQLFYEILK
jgi:glycosyltransferase involved in cell wall biosynthesis